MDAKRHKALLIACVAAVAVAAAAVFAAMGTHDPWELSWNLEDSRVAARVEDTVITEGEVTAAVRDVYESLGAEGEQDWLSYLESRQLTATEFRNQQLERLVHGEVVRRAAERLGVEVEDADVRVEVDATREDFLADDTSGNPEEAWRNALRLNGYSEDSYEEFLRTALVEQGLAEKIGRGEAYASWIADFESSLAIERVPAPNDLPYLP